MKEKNVKKIVKDSYSEIAKKGVAQAIDLRDVRGFRVFDRDGRETAVVGEVSMGMKEDAGAVASSGVGEA